jgi:S-formylglutathione hydrolase FrmB
MHEPSKGRPPRLAILTALSLAVLLPALVAAQPVRLDDSKDIRVEAVEQLDARQLAVRVGTAALQQPVDLRILLPDGYGDGKRRYPVLYLFHGTSGRASDWVNAGNVVETTAGLPLIVVMPDAGFNGDGGGWFADWYNGGAGGQPMWETFHIEQVIPWIDANLRTVSARHGRAVAGLSQGGFGALTYAARHPELFTSVASFSGGCTIAREPLALQISSFIIGFTTSVLSGIDDEYAIFGPPDTNLINWLAHDPGMLVENLRGMHVALWAGDGTPGPLDPTPIDPAASNIETITFTATELFHGYLNEVGIEHFYNYYGGGTHIWPYWARDLQEYMGPLMERFADRAPAPRPVSYVSLDDEWDGWGWRATLDAQRPSVLARGRRRGFVFTGNGTVIVRTPRFFKPGQQVRVYEQDAGGSGVLFAGPNGRLQVPLILGEGDPRTVRVRFREAP